MPLTGRSSSQRPGPPSRDWVARADASTASCESTTSLGSPVLPDVRTTIGSPPKRTHGSSSSCTSRVEPVTGRRDAVMSGSRWRLALVQRVVHGLALDPLRQ